MTTTVCPVTEFVVSVADGKGLAERAATDLAELIRASTPVCEFFVPGEPKPAGSKSAFAFKRRDGTLGARVTDSSGNKGKAWRTLVSDAAQDAMGSREPVPGGTPLILLIEFTVVRPASHHVNANRSRPLSPTKVSLRPAKRPDVTKLVRAVEDAMTGIVWADDAQVVHQLASKVYGTRPGARVIVMEIRA